MYNAGMHDAERPIRCPRCGYDLRGKVATWEDACPLAGTCTECGLTFGWAEVILPEKFEPTWCVEGCGRGAVRFIRSCIGTLARSFVPWSFWRRLSMSHRIRPRRIAAYLGVLVFCLVLLYAGIQSATALYVRSIVVSELETQAQSYPMMARQLRAALQPNNTQQPGARGANAPLRQYLQQLDPETRATEMRRLSRELRTIQQLIANPPYVDHSAIECMIEAVFLPLGGSSWGTIVSANGRTPYVAPSSLYEVATDGAFLQAGWAFGTRNDVFEYFIPTVAITGVSLIGLFGLPLSMVLLPVSRKRAKVRWGHIWRVLAYSAFIPVTVIVIVTAVFLTGILLSALTGSLPEPLIITAAGGIALILPWIMLILWWTFAINRYLRIPHGLAIALIMSILCIITTATAVFYIGSLLVGSPIIY